MDDSINTDQSGLNTTNVTNTSITGVASSSTTTAAGPSTTSQSSEQLLVLRRESQPNQSIHALMSARMHNRKRIIVDYLNKHKICTKYDITREIRAQERAQNLTGCIDAKTTKRMLMTLESERKLRTFEMPLKSVSYMCVCAPDIDESHELYKNYTSTFKRTFDSVDLSLKNNESGSESDEDGGGGGDDDGGVATFKLTNSFIESVVSQLKYLNVRKRLLAAVPKFQKAIILHRFLHYLLYFYDGVQQSVSKF